MEEPESIPRREAIAGLTILGALAVALVGTIVFRIVHAAPLRATPASAAAWASTGDPTPMMSEPDISDGSPLGDANIAASSLPEAAPIPTDGNSASVPAALTSDAPAWQAGVPQPAAPEWPRFVAPASH